jgi:hypothetical protein
LQSFGLDTAALVEYHFPRTETRRLLDQRRLGATLEINCQVVRKYIEGIISNQ